MSAKKWIEYKCKDCGETEASHPESARAEKSLCAGCFMKRKHAEAVSHRESMR